MYIVFITQFWRMVTERIRQASKQASE